MSPKDAILEIYELNRAQLIGLFSSWKSFVAVVLGIAVIVTELLGVAFNPVTYLPLVILVAALVYSDTVDNKTGVSIIGRIVDNFVDAILEGKRIEFDTLLDIADDTLEDVMPELDLTDPDVLAEFDIDELERAGVFIRNLLEEKKRLLGD